jgi:hypothetical protein
MTNLMPVNIATETIRMETSPIKWSTGSLRRFVRMFPLAMGRHSQWLPETFRES